MDKIKEKITFYRNIFTLFFTALFILGSGLANTYFFNREALTNFDNLILFDIGLSFEVILIILAIYLIIRIKKLIKEL